MSNSGPEHRARYKLVPQSNSDDSDLSEKELQSLNRDGFQVITKKLLRSSKTYRTDINQRNLPFRNKMSAKTNRTDVFISFHKKSQMTNEFDCMSFERKFLFGFSIVLCFIVVTLFLFIPCNWSNCSHKVIGSASSEIWIKMLPNIELVGRITPVYSADQNNFNFVFLARGCIFADVAVIRTNFTSSVGGDALCLNGLSGKQQWRKHFNKMPNDLNCSIFSSKNETQKDCIIISYLNFVTAVSPLTGQARWYTPLSSKNNKTRQNFPILLPDLNHDSTTDLLILKDVNKITILSGRLGNPVSNDFKSLSQNCSEIRNLRLSDHYSLLLDCFTVNGTYSNLSVLLDKEVNTSTFSRISQHQPFETLNQLFVRNLTIGVTNEGTICPRKCKSIVQISSFHKKIVWSREFPFTYVMTPQSFDLTAETGMYGFVFKIWEREHESVELKKPKMLQNSKKLTANLIYERTVMVLFNESTVESAQTVNISSYPIMQMYDAQKSIQPDPVSQRHSLTISDVWNNGSYQLVSYYSTFEDEKKNNYSFTDYILRSYVRIFDLEKEIFKSLNFSAI